MVDEEIVKPSKIVYNSANVSLKEGPIWRVFEIIDIPTSRVGAKLVSSLIIEKTSSEDLELLKGIQESNRQNRLQGIKGRPTKKDRRKLDGLRD